MCIGWNNIWNVTSTFPKANFIKSLGGTYMGKKNVGEQILSIKKNEAKERKDRIITNIKKAEKTAVRIATLTTMALEE